MAGSSQPFTAPPQHDGTLTVHNRSVEEYQQIYHSVVDDMLRYGCVKNLQDYFNHLRICHSSFPHMSFFCYIYHNHLFSVFSSTRHRYNTGRLRPYSLKLGRRIKQKLWERLDRPRIRTSVKKDGLVHVELSYRVGVSPPSYDIDTLGEPEPITLQLRDLRNRTEMNGFNGITCK